MFPALNTDTSCVQLSTKLEMETTRESSTSIAAILTARESVSSSTMAKGEPRPTEECLEYLVRVKTCNTDWNK